MTSSVRPVARLFALASMAAAVPAGDAESQIAGARFCAASVVYNESPSVESAEVVGRMHPLVSRARFAVAVRDEQWEAVLRALRDDVMQAFAAAGVQQPHQRTFLAQLDSVLAVIPQLPGPGDAARTTFVVQSVRPIRFQPVMGVEAFQLFHRGEAIVVAGLPDDQARALCWSALSVDAVLFRLQKPLELEALGRLARLNTAWSNYRTYGYTRQPLELFLFRGSVHDSLPPKRQWLAGHLSLGAEVRGRFSDSLSASNVTVVEVGHLWYRGNWTQYSGVSAIAGFAGRSSIGYGAMVHFARSMRAGVLLHGWSGRTTRSLVVSTDLYGLLERSKKSVEEGLAIARGIVVLPRPER